MKGALSKAVSALLVLLFTVSLFTLTSCNRKYDETEVIEETKKLLKEAKMLNEVYYGSGIKYFDSEEDKGNYKKANSIHLEELGFSTIDGLKEMTEKVFSDEYSALIYSTILSPLKDGDYYLAAARYYQAYDEETNEPTFIMVNSGYSPMMKDNIEYDLDTVKVDGSKKERVYVKLNATVTNSEGQSQITELTVTLIEEDDGWKIDGPTYANYNPYKDVYEELKNKDIK